ncbi:unnamed protein product [Lathyrus sativus]|nr:unnamed protein product [Lathyrus sativus]
MGDFNNVLNIKDKIGGKHVKEFVYIDLSTFMENACIFEVESIGDRYTWFNKHTGGAIYSKIDRVIANMDLMQQTIQKMVHVMELGISDHMLLCLKGNEENKNKHFDFKFLNEIADMEWYHEAVRRSWRQRTRGNPINSLWKKVMRLQPVLIKLRKPLVGIKKQIDKIDWIRLGDGNNSYFHASLKSKQKKNNMSKSCTVYGIVISTHEAIVEEVLDFYGKLLGTTKQSLEGIAIVAHRKGK